MDEERLNKVIARQLAIGRRQADTLIEKGKVLVNDLPARMGQRVVASDKITVNGQTLSAPKGSELQYIAFNKPIGYVCSRRQQGDAPTIYQLLPSSLQHLKTVGRLDKESSGLILLTNDGDFAHRLTHPSFVKQKNYEVEIDAPLQPLHRQMIADFGVDLPDGKSKLGLERLQEGNEQRWRVAMHEGRNRQIRRTFAALGYTVTKLHRTSFGSYDLNNIESGKFTTITPV